MIFVIGKVKGKMFSFEMKIISVDDLKDNMKVILEFDSDKINSYVEKKEKEENSLKNKLIEFFIGYVMVMNLVFNMNDFNFILSYFKKNLFIYILMKSNF